MKQKKTIDKKVMIPAIVAVVLAAVFLLLLIYRNMPEQRYQRKLITGTRYLKQLDFENATLTFQDAVEIRPERTEAYVMAAQSYVRWGNEIYDSGSTDQVVDYLVASNEKLIRATESYETAITLEAESVEPLQAEVSQYYEPLIAVYSLQAERYEDVDAKTSAEYAAKAEDAAQRYEDTADGESSASSILDRMADGAANAGGEKDDAAESEAAAENEGTADSTTEASEEVAASSEAAEESGEAANEAAEETPEDTGATGSTALEAGALHIRNYYRYAETTRGNAQGEALIANAEAYPKLAEALEVRAGEVDDGMQAFIEELDSWDYDSDDYDWSSYYDVTVSLGRADKKYVSFVQNYSQYFLGAAHGNMWSAGFTYDVETGEKLGISDFVGADSSTLSSAAVEALTNTYGSENVSALDEYLSMSDGLQGTLASYFEQILTDKDSAAVTWYLENDGIHVIFDQYEIGPYAAGSFHISLSYADYPQLYKEVPEDVSGSGLHMGLPRNTSGSLVGYEATVIYDSTGSNPGFTLLYNEETYEGSEYVLGVNGAYYYERGDQLFLYIIAYAENDYGYIEVFDLSDGKIQFVGSMENAGPTVYEIGSTGSVTSTNMLWLDPNQISLASRSSILSTGTMRRTYRIDENGMLVPNEGWYDYEWTVATDNVLTTEADVPAEKITDSELANVPESGESVTVPAGTKLYFYRTDGSTKTDMKAEDGTIYRFTIDAADEWPKTINGTEIMDLFDEPMYAG